MTTRARIAEPPFSQDFLRSRKGEEYLRSITAADLAECVKGLVGVTDIRISTTIGDDSALSSNVVIAVEKKRIIRGRLKEGHKISPWIVECFLVLEKSGDWVLSPSVGVASPKRALEEKGGLLSKILT
mgnify:CR=1 FL=1|tara:strand:+ start:73 stop:456 length:384 start_codon:yes stop_codon:yes gene_type:complete